MPRESVVSRISGSARARTVSSILKQFRNGINVSLYKMKFFFSRHFSPSISHPSNQYPRATTKKPTMSDGRNSEKDQLSSTHNPFFFHQFAQQNSPHQNYPTNRPQANQNSNPALRLPSINHSPQSSPQFPIPFSSLVGQGPTEHSTQPQSTATTTSLIPPSQSTPSSWRPTPTQAYLEVSAPILASVIESSLPIPCWRY